MNPTNSRVTTVLTVAALVLFLGAFLALATDFGHNWDNHHENNNLAALNTTTSTSETLPVTTTTTFQVTTTTTPVATTIVRVTPTTAKRTTTTRRTTATTKKPRAVAPHSGAGTEDSDNAGAFTTDANGIPSGQSPPACSSSDPLCFELGVIDGQLAISLFNNTDKTIAFPGNLNITVSMSGSGGSSSFVISPLDTDGHPISSIGPNSGVDVRSGRPFDPNGSFTFTAKCQVDYGS